MAKEGEISIVIKAEELGVELERIFGEVEENFNQALGDLAVATYAKIVASAQEKLNSTRQDYLKGISFDKIGENQYVIEIDDAWAKKLEEGFPSYNMKDAMLKSQGTVKSGQRAGQPWVQVSKKGHKFAHVPMDQNPFSKAVGSKDLNQVIQGLKSPNAAGRMQKFTSIFKDASGRPLQGKVAIAKNTGATNLEGLVKYQHTYTNDKGKETTQSLYVLYRTISENPETKEWIHPGFKGLQAFPEAQEYLEREIENLLRLFTQE